MVRGIEKICISALLLIGFFIVDGNQLEIYLQAKKECQEKNIPQAIKLFESLEQKGDAVLYNLGVCYFQQGEVASAIAYWYLALSKASYSLFPSITNAMAQAGTGDSLSAYGIKWYLMRWSTLFSLGTWQLLIIISFIFFLILLFVKRRGFAFILALITLFFIVIGSIKNNLINHPVLMIKIDKAALHLSPDESFDSLKALDKGSFVSVLQKADQWYKIRQQNQTGWVKKDNLITDDPQR